MNFKHNQEQAGATELQPLEIMVGGYRLSWYNSRITALKTQLYGVLRLDNDRLTFILNVIKRV
jgi:hypothetical protein